MVDDQGATAWRTDFAFMTEHGLDVLPETLLEQRADLRTLPDRVRRNVANVIRLATTSPRRYALNLRLWRRFMRTRTAREDVLTLLDAVFHPGPHNSHVARHRLVGVFGASGAGKSSLLRAGLIPRLRDGNPHRRVVVFTPGADPLLPCANRLAAVTDADPDKTREALTAGRHGLDAFIREWSAEQPAGARPLATITGHTDVVYTLAISPDGRTLATGSGDHTTRLWNIADPRQPDQIATLTGHSDTVRAVAFSPDGRTLATGSADHTARLWSTDPEQIAARICREATPAITAAEWEHYFPNVTYQPPCPS